MDREPAFSAYVAARRARLFRTACLLCGDPHPGSVSILPIPRTGRHRLLRADGTEHHLRLEVDPAPAVPGPEVVVIDRVRYEGEGTAAVQFAFRFDESAGTLQLQDVPRNDLRLFGNSWGPNTDEALRFVQAIDCRVDRVVGGSVEQYDDVGMTSSATGTTASSASTPTGSPTAG
jgi:hypothetical protein